MVQMSTLMQKQIIPLQMVKKLPTLKILNLRAMVMLKHLLIKQQMEAKQLLNLLLTQKI